MCRPHLLEISQIFIYMTNFPLIFIAKTVIYQARHNLFFILHYQNRKVIISF